MSIWSTKVRDSRTKLGIIDERIVRIDLWNEGASEYFPKITVSVDGLVIEGTDKEFNRLIKILAKDSNSKIEPRPFQKNGN
jgi:hypothetical protein